MSCRERSIARATVLERAEVEVGWMNSSDEGAQQRAQARAEEGSKGRINATIVGASLASIVALVLVLIFALASVSEDLVG